MSSRPEARINISSKLLGDDNAGKMLRKNICSRYADMADACYYDVNMQSLIRGNKKTYSVLIDDGILSCVFMMQGGYPEYKDIVADRPSLGKMFSDIREAKRVLEDIASKCSLNDCDVSLQSLIEGIGAFNSTAYEPIPMDADEAEDEIDELPTEDLIEDTEIEGTEDITFNAKQISCLKSSKDTSKIDSIEDNLDDDTDYSEEDFDDSDLDEIGDVIQTIIQKNEAIFRTCLELDRPYGLLYEKGMLTYKIENGTVKYKAGANQSGVSMFERLYSAITSAYKRDIICANDLRNVPTMESIGTTGVNYYPGFIFKYALGTVGSTVFKNWNKFSEALENDITKRVRKMYKAGIFYDNIDKIQQSFSNAVLVIDYERGAGMKLRVCITGKTIDASIIEANIRQITAYANSSIVITPVQNCKDVVDIQILIDEKNFYSRPSWAYKAMEVKINNGDKINLNEGIPIGRQINGDIVNFKFDPSNDFMTFIAAGSGAGKGVLTLSLVGAAMGSGIPVMYTDYKPDMAPVFWDIEKELGIKTYTFDGMIQKRPGVTADNQTLAWNLNPKFESTMRKYCGTLVYLKSLQVMFALAQWRIQRGESSPVIFIFDEVQALQKSISAMMSTVYQEINSSKPKGKDPGDVERFEFFKGIADFVKDIDAQFTTYTITTGRASSVYSIFIGQSPNAMIWNDMRIPKNGDYPALEIFGKVTRAGTVRKIIGRGASGSKYGLSELEKNELSYISEHRFFGMYNGNVCTGADVTVFKPFLTLNNDDIFSRCWTGGIGKSYGYGTVSTEEYQKNVSDVHPGTNKYGVHKGTGLVGLTEMYCDGDSARMKAAFSAGDTYVAQFMESVGLSRAYSTIGEYLYDASKESLLSVDDLLKFNTSGFNKDGSTGEEGFIDSGISMGDSVEQPHEVFNTGININDNPVGSEHTEEVRNIVEQANDDPKYINDEDYLSEQEALKAFNNSNAEIEEPMNGAEEINQSDYDDDETNENVVMIERSESAFGCSPANRKETTCNSSMSDNCTRLVNGKNCIDCSKISMGPVGKFEELYMNTPKGAERYARKLWDTVLDGIISHGFKVAHITRVSIYAGQMYINGKIVNLNGLLGGTEDIRIRDIVIFGRMFKRYTRISTLRIDEDLLEAAVVELGTDAINKMFIMGKYLKEVIIIKDTGGTSVIKRGDALSEDTINRVKTAAGNNEFDVYCRAKSTSNWNTASYSDRIWGMRLAKSAVGKSGKAFMNKNQPKIASAIALGVGGLVIGTIGGASWALVSGVKGIIDLAGSFRR